jgi:importin-7
MACLDDPELPVRCQAALALQPLLRHDYVVNAMRPQIPLLMQRLLSLVNEVDADTLSAVMEEFVEQFSNELTPFAVDLALNLVKRIVHKADLREKRSCV